jgi:predicted nucleic acid-binding protein
VIAYLDSSILARAYLADEDGHREAAALLGDPELALVTGTWTQIEVSGALIRAARSGRGDEQGLLALLDADLAETVTVLQAPQQQVEAVALELVRSHAIRAMDAWHLAVAKLTVPGLAEGDEPQAFASRDDAQRAVAHKLGFVML